MGNHWQLLDKRDRRGNGKKEEKLFYQSWWGRIELVINSNGKFVGKICWRFIGFNDILGRLGGWTEDGKWGNIGELHLIMCNVQVKLFESSNDCLIMLSLL